jgi:hypothetical protein
MRTDEFWAVVDRARGDGAVGIDVVAKRAVADLSAREPDDILAWDRHLAKVMTASYVENLWAAAYLINGGCSDDGFDYFRGWLIAHGRDVFARAVREPDSLADLPAVRAAAASRADFDGEEVLSIGVDAYLAVTGEEPPPDRYDDAPALPSVEEFWDFDDEDEMQRRLPRLSALFLAPPEG